MRKLWFGIVVAFLVATLALPVLAAPGTQGSGGVHFGPYTLDAGSQITQDLVVFGGPVSLRTGSVFSGDLTVFGPATIENGATLDGQLVVMGTADVGGRVEGDVFAAGALTLDQTAYVGGDVTTAGTLSQADGAVVVGEVLPVEQGEWQGVRTLPFPLIGTWRPQVQIDRTPRWVDYLLRVVRAVVGLTLIGLLSLVVVSLWPVHTDRVGRAIEEAVLTSYGAGLLGLLVAGLIAVVLAITICLSPFAAIGLILVGIGVLLGWIALGLVVGRRILTGLFNQTAPKPVISAVVGTMLVSAVVVASQIFGLLTVVLVVLLIPPAAGAVLLTRFGTRPYATRGVPVPVGGSVPPPRVPPSSTRTVQPPAETSARPASVQETAAEEAGAEDATDAEREAEQDGAPEA